MNKETDEDKAFEAALKGKMGWKCPCSLEITDNESGLLDLSCLRCGKSFKSNKDRKYCMDCSKKSKL